MKIISGKQMVRILKKRGWKLTVVSGSHHKLRHPDYHDHIVVPVHGNRDLDIGIQVSIMKTAGLTAADL